jgi:hypothetical protein
MTKPTKPTVPPAPSRANPGPTFSQLADTFAAFQTVFADYMDASADFVDDRADAALAAALLGTLPPLTGQAGRFPRVNPSGTALEFLPLSGIGVETAQTITNLNTHQVGGTFFAASSATGLPVAEAFVVVHETADTDQRAVQEVFGLSSGRRWWRVESGGTWSSWIEVNNQLTVASLASAAVRILSEGYASPVDTELATAAWAASGMIGAGQTWQDVTGSRALATTYTNTTGRPIMVVLQITATSGVTVNFLVGGAVVSSFANNGSGGTVFTHSVIIPAGGTYSASNGNISVWRELR